MLCRAPGYVGVMVASCPTVRANHHTDSKLRWVGGGGGIMRAPECVCLAAS